MSNPNTRDDLKLAQVTSSAAVGDAEVHGEAAVFPDARTKSCRAAVANIQP